MGAGASIPDTLDKDTAKQISGEKWNEEKFNELAVDGKITKEQFTGAGSLVESASTPVMKTATEKPAADDADAAATKLQAAARGKADRAVVEAKKETKIKEDNAAQKLQSVARGKADRAAVEVKKETKVKEENAAQKLQSVARGTNTRKSISQKQAVVAANGNALLIELLDKDNGVFGSASFSEEDIKNFPAGTKEFTFGDAEDAPKLTLRFKLSKSLTCKVIGARKLKKMDITGASDPFAVVYYQQTAANERQAMLRTPVIPKELNPDWENQSATMQVPGADASGTSLEIEVWDKDLITANDFMGMVSWKGDQLLKACSSSSQAEAIPEFPLKAKDGSDAEGKLRVKLSGMASLQISVEKCDCNSAVAAAVSFVYKGAELLSKEGRLKPPSEKGAKAKGFVTISDVMQFDSQLQSV